MAEKCMDTDFSPSAMDFLAWDLCLHKRFLSNDFEIIKTGVGYALPSYSVALVTQSQ